MGLPKRRHSNARTRKRRAHDALSVPAVTVCPHCRERKLPHRVCPSCGTYRGREVVKQQET
ncbi:MAG: 50S ribosomal protein L32 [candidate division NC10 bacterium]|nr:50S ribosomal protein L32 [candidate division NC10 bacterium]